MGLGLGISVDWASLVPYYAKVASAFAARVKADGGTVENTACLKKDLKVLSPTPPPAFTGLLNTYSGAAAAYSLRLLDNTYTGDAIVVRRSSDNTTQNIGFVNNELDTASLESFCSGTDGFVTTWYDQSGNGYNVAQATASAQPQIVSSGSTILMNGKPTLDNLGSTQLKHTSNVFAASGVDRTIVSAYKINADNSVVDTLFDNGSTSVPMPVAKISNQWRAYSTSGAAVTLNSSFANEIGVHRLITTNENSTNYEAFLNGSSKGTATTSRNVMTGVHLGIFRSEGSNFGDVNIQEWIIWNSDQGTNRSGIETNINDFYSIY